MGRIYPDPVRPRPTRMEASSRFWCGFAAGALLGTFFALAFFLSSPLWAAVTVGLTALTCAVLAVPYGEDFWEGLNVTAHFMMVFGCGDVPESHYLTHVKSPANFENVVGRGL